MKLTWSAFALILQLIFTFYLFTPKGAINIIYSVYPIPIMILVSLILIGVDYYSQNKNKLMWFVLVTTALYGIFYIIFFSIFKGYGG